MQGMPIDDLLKISTKFFLKNLGIYKNIFRTYIYVIIFQNLEFQSRCFIRLCSGPADVLGGETKGYVSPQSHVLNHQTSQEKTKKKRVNYIMT